MSRANRRQFLCLSASLGGAAAVGLAGQTMQAALGAEPASSIDSWNDVRRTSWALGSDITIRALHRNADVATAAISDAFNELERVEQLMSIYRADSQLSQLNRDGFLERPHPYFLRVLRYARQLSEQTGGAFDVTVQPYWQLYRSLAKQKRLPGQDQLEHVAGRVNWRQVELSDRRIRFSRAGMSITLNGIAQGFAADRAAAALRNGGVEHALIDTGEINSLGTNKRGAWSIGIQHPRHKDAYISLAKLAGRCLATSGDYESTFSDDYRHHHLIDPRSGRSPARLASVSVAAATATQADALSTALFVLGPERGSRLISATRDADALLVLKNGRTLVTAGFPAASAREGKA